MRLALFLLAFPLAAALAGCDPPTLVGGGASTRAHEQGPPGGDTPGAAGSTATGDDGGGTSGSMGGGADAGSATAPPPPPSLPPEPNGFQTTIAPLLDAQGCTECHHHGRPIDLTTYPFMAGSTADVANRLIVALGGAMPPAPRERAPASVIDRVKRWQAEGMKP